MYREDHPSGWKGSETRLSNAYRERTDEALMVALSQGEERALDELYRRYQRPLFGFAVRYIGNAEMAMDAVQETFLRVHENGKNYRPTAKFSSWIFRILRNLCIDEKRRYWNRYVRAESQFASKDDEPSRIVTDFPSETQTGAETVLEDELNRRIKDAIDNLSPEQREVMLLNKYQGLSYKEIAEIVGITVESVKQRAYRGHLRLRQVLKDLVEE
jgi:RNA polymerase sigma-70 factor (ECF subfamily)